MGNLEGVLPLLFAGDVDALDRLIGAEPEILRARVASKEGHYCGYFHGATLLHHVAGNPTIAPLSARTVEVTRLLLDRGAEVDAVTLQGPAQPTDIGWSTLGLAATSLVAREGGFQKELLELLVSRGADVNLRNGGALIGALYYREDAGAEWLVAHGARTDLVAAAGLGRIDLMEEHATGEDAHALTDYGQWREPVRTREDILSLALVYACRANRDEAVRWLLAHGADPRRRAAFDHSATPLHWASHEGHREIAKLLLEAGADPSLRDTSFKATARGWATHNGHPEVAALLPPDEPS